LLLRWNKMLTSEAVQYNTSLIEPTNTNPSIYTCFSVKLMPEHLRLLFWNAVLQRACLYCFYSKFLLMYKVVCVEACFMMYQVFAVIHLFNIVCIQLWLFYMNIRSTQYAYCHIFSQLAPASDLSCGLETKFCFTAMDSTVFE